MRSGAALLFCLLLLNSCREPYQPPTVLAQSNLLVIDAFLDGTDGSCIVVLSRSQNVSDSEVKPMEKKATVQLEDSKGIVYTLAETSDGNYSISNVTIDTQLKYQLRIKTEEGKSYQSDFVEMKKTPPMDDVTWKATGQGLQFYVSTHDDEKKSIYYQYRFVETWEYIAPLYSSFEVQNGVAVPRAQDIYHCWRTAPSSRISIATSVKLSDDIISNFPFYLIEKPSEKYLFRYSILVKQNVLAVDAYHYWQKLQKNTEKIGTLFDPQPTQILSNLHNIDNADEPVLGYFNAGITTEKRIFVDFYELPRDWYFSGDGICQAQSDKDTILTGALNGFTGFLIRGLYDNSPSPYGFLYSTSPYCADCRVSGGGTTTKPDFW
jgi:hypothetical protein